MNKRILCCLTLTAVFNICTFGQAALRDYVGIINLSFHPNAVSYLEKVKRQSSEAAARNIDSYIQGDTGTGFVYVAPGGKNYILTNYHVISNAHSLSIKFEKQNGQQTTYSGLTVVAADEDMDIALLEFGAGRNPFREGLSFYTRPVAEGDDVFSAGFPGLGPAMIWQFGRGMVSNASVRVPASYDSDKILGPFIQHTAQVDSGNSGGPLLIQNRGVTTGYSVVGINTLKARNRQAANYSIPVSRIQEFINTALKKESRNERSRLETKVDSFIAGLGVNKAVYPHIAEYLSYTCIAENTEYAFSELSKSRSRSTQDDINTALVYSPADGMSLAVAWLIENRIRPAASAIRITTESITPNGSGFTVTFKANNTTFSSEWVNNYGIWQINSFSNLVVSNSRNR